MLFALWGLANGTLIAGQTAANAGLKRLISSTYLASLISFSTGTLFLIILASLFGLPLTLNLAQLDQEPFWMLLGGVYGVIFISINMTLFPYLGSVQTTLLPIMGQILMTMLIDNFGWFGTQIIPFTGQRLWGIIFLILGIFFAVAYRDLRHRKSLSDTSKSLITPLKIWLLRALGITAGMLVGIQITVNGQLGLHLGVPVQSALLNFLVGTTTLILVVLIKDRSLVGLKGLVREKVPFWTLLGGIFGAIYVLVNVVLVGKIGPGQTIIYVLFGQITGSILIENLGLFHATKQNLTFYKIFGIFLMLVGIVIVQ